MNSSDMQVLYDDELPILKIFLMGFIILVDHKLIHILTSCWLYIWKNSSPITKNKGTLPVKIFLMVKGLSPSGESFPPSKLKPSPVPSFFNTTVRGEPRGTSTNFKSKIKHIKNSLWAL